ncbi:SAM-dependent methyltransferase [Edwardsiella piscicida]|uniref:hypothetical protein n=1 Tax=Enterobacterales TaxID=91347 RepID=UPI0002C056D4|nr:MULTISPECIES: hypothetical protein [Enterobacterales]AGH75059.1 hypothetical protein ETAC_14690 [Edwardsiella piscicida C07-087]EKS7784517.1 SAM-dependent methyltransferase [Edwardsiella piscicida]UCQ34203.1 SAM-dependent methyltransferase [Edwardsiella piscicida]SXK24003.1 Putative RNA methylase family UPF0020 [Klebsiella pneumoniae]
MKNKYFSKKWEQFKKELPHQSGEMVKRNWGHNWHSMCSYQGKLKPSIARSLIDTFMPSGKGRILDVFSGVGTIPFEARLLGHTAYGFDISPAAVNISRAKLEVISKNEIQEVINKLSDFIDQNKNSIDYNEHNLIRFNGSIESYFHPETFKEILCARKFFLIKGELDASESLVQSCLLHILHGNRPYALSRKSHPITPFAPTGDFIYSNLVIKLIKKVERVLLNSDGIPDTGSKVFYQDSTKSWPEEVNNLDAIITSPPFYDSTRFYSANWMRLWFSGWEKDDFQTKPKDFVDETQKKSFEIYDNIFKQSQQCLKKDGVFLMHVGKSKKSDMAGQIAKIGSNYLSLIDIFDESVEHCESHGIKDKGTTTHHQYLVFTKD